MQAVDRSSSPGVFSSSSHLLLLGRPVCLSRKAVWLSSELALESFLFWMEEKSDRMIMSRVQRIMPLSVMRRSLVIWSE